MDDEQLEFVGKRHRRSGAARSLGAMAAPVASHGGAVVDDPSLLRYADAVIAAFGRGDIDQGLTRAQIIERVIQAGDVDRAELDRRMRPPLISSSPAVIRSAVDLHRIQAVAVLALDRSRESQAAFMTSGAVVCVDG